MILQVSPLGWEALVIALLALLGCLVQPCSAAGQHGGTAGPLNGLIYPGPWLGQWGLFCPMRPLIQQAHLGLFSTRANLGPSLALQAVDHKTWSSVMKTT